DGGAYAAQVERARGILATRRRLDLVDVTTEGAGRIRELEREHRCVGETDDRGRHELAEERAIHECRIAEAAVVVERVVAGVIGAGLRITAEADVAGGD